MIPIPDRMTLKLVVGVAAALLLALLIHDRNHWKAKAEQYAQLLGGERAAHSATVANYRAAAERARREDAENIARVRAGQAAINERTANDFESRIAAARASAGRLRRQPESAAADSGRGGAAPVPVLSAAAQGASQTAREDGLPEPDRLIATEQAIQLDELIKWVRRQAAVSQDGGPGARQVDVPVTVAPAEAGASGRICTESAAANPTKMPACAGMPIRY